MAQKQPDYAVQLVHLRGQLSRPRLRSGPAAERARVERLDWALATRNNRIVRLRKEIADLEAELRWAEDEAEGYRKGLVLAMTDLLEAMGPPRVIRQAPPPPSTKRAPSGPTPETWSPVPVLGFRYWAIKGNRAYGFRTRWTSPHMEAACRGFPQSRDIPHTDGRCGRLGCGVYAVKDLDPLLAAISRETVGWYVVGLVGLEGKVVEHDLGYRASSATVVAAAAVGDAELLLTADRSELATLFAQPRTLLLTPATAGQRAENVQPKQRNRSIRTYLLERAKEHETWISATSNE